MPTATEIFRNFILRRQHYLHRVENGVISQMVPAYSTALRETYARLVALEDYGTGYTLDWRMARLNAQLAEIEEVLSVAAAEAAGTLDAAMVDLAVEEGFGYGNMLQQQLSMVGVNIVNLPYKHIDYTLSNPLLGESVGESLLWTNREAVRGIRQSITQSVIQGEDIGRAARRLINPATVGLTGQTERFIKNRVDMVARSELQYVSNQVSRSIYADNMDVLGGAQYVATLDGRTCVQCGSLDGRVFRYSDGQDHGGPRLPLHVRCRCCYVPVVKSWRQLGIDADEFPTSTRASFSGQVPETMSYEEWLGTQSTKFQQDALGPTRYKLWSRGDIRLPQMATTNRILKVSELETLATNAE